MKKRMDMLCRKARLTGQKLAVLRMVCTICVALGWWGMLYPDFTMTPDTYQVVWEENAVQQEESMVEWDAEEEIYTMVLRAESGQIRFRSKLLSGIENILRYFR